MCSHTSPGDYMCRATTVVAAYACKSGEAGGERSFASCSSEGASGELDYRRHDNELRSSESEQTDRRREILLTQGLLLELAVYCKLLQYMYMTYLMFTLV